MLIKNSQSVLAIAISAALLSGHSTVHAHGGSHEHEHGHEHVLISDTPQNDALIGIQTTTETTEAELSRADRRAQRRAHCQENPEDCMGSRRDRRSAGAVNSPDAETPSDVDGVTGDSHTDDNHTNDNTEATPLETALATGDWTRANSLEEIRQALLQATSPESAQNPEIIKAFYRGVRRLDWVVGGVSRGIGQWLPSSQQVLASFTTPDGDQRNLAVAGEGGGRYLALAANPLTSRNGELSPSMGNWLENGIEWLAGFTPAESRPVNVVVAQIPRSRGDQSLNRWLSNRLGNRIAVNDANACDGASLERCLDSETDILILSNADTSNEEAILSQLRTARRNGTAVLFVHSGQVNDVGTRTLAELGLGHGGGLRSNARITNYSPADARQVSSELLPHIRYLVDGLENHFGINYSACGGNCKGPSNEVLDHLQTVRHHLVDMSRLDIRLFETNPDRLLQLLVLWADGLRSQAAYGEAAIAQPQRRNERRVVQADTFTKNLVADYLVYFNRDYQPAAPDIGNYSRTDFSHIAPRTVNLDFETLDGFSSTGVYMFPGQTMEVTITGGDEVDLSLMVSSVKSGATREWMTYNRPKFVGSPKIRLERGKTYRFTSPFGGPLYLNNNADVYGDHAHIRFTNVGEHPVLTLNGRMSGQQMQHMANRFTEAVNRNEYDWVDIVFPSFQAHARMDTMPKTLDAVAAAGGDLTYLYRATTEYFQHNLYRIAGMLIPGMEPDPEVHGWIEGQGWTVPLRTEVRHSNHDQSSCGAACGGNPMDMSGAFVPPVQGSAIMHELGHSVMENFTTPQAANGHGLVNLYGEYVRAWMKDLYAQRGWDLPWYVNPDGSRATFQCQRRPWEVLYNGVLERQRTGKPSLYQEFEGQKSIQSDTMTLLNYELQAIAEDNGVVTDRFALAGRLHAYAREFERGLTSEARWQAVSNSLGYTRISYSQAQRMNRSETLVIAYSVITGRDYREWFEYLSLDAQYTPEMRALINTQLNALSFRPLNVPNGLYIPEQADGYCQLGNLRVVEVAGQPIETQRVRGGNVTSPLYPNGYSRHRDSTAAGYTQGRADNYADPGDE